MFIDTFRKLRTDAAGCATAQRAASSSTCMEYGATIGFEAHDWPSNPYQQPESPGNGHPRRQIHQNIHLCCGGVN
jgi:hypothetical protein